MAKQGITIELDDETVRCLAVLGAPVEVLARLAYSAAEGVRSPDQERRDQTDVSLRVERDKTDVDLAKASTMVERVADDVMRVARDRADQIVKAARTDTDHEGGLPWTATEGRFERSRSRADGVLAGERASADSLLEHERVGLRHRQHEFLANEREATDKDLGGERAHSDSLIVDQREANARMVSATIRAQELAVEATEAKARAEESEVELRAVAEFREMFMGILGHDLRNPLNTMVMASGLLIARGGLTDEGIRLANRISSSGQRMARMIGQLVEFTRARLGGGFVLELAPSNLGDVCRDIADELRISSSVEIRQASEGSLDGTWDADRLKEAVSNIAGNAVDHAAPRTPVVLRAYEEGEAVVAEITNHGACIPADVLPVLFKPFRRGRPEANADTGHLGLGLYIASEIVRVHGGTLDVRSSDGTTTFTLKLPRVSIPPPPSSARSVR